jgi:hypothetical protein
MRTRLQFRAGAPRRGSLGSGPPLIGTVAEALAVCRSAVELAPAGQEELAVFDTHAAGGTETGRVAFADWNYG